MYVTQQGSDRGEHAPQIGDCPLVVDLDGTLIAGDLLAETLIAQLARTPAMAPSLFARLRRGKADLKHFLVDLHPLNVSHLPYRQPVLDLIAQARADGRRVYLATASHEHYARAIADHLGLFDGFFASSATQNLASHRKADLLVAEFGEGNFDYVGNSADDLAVWKRARHCYAIGLNGGVARRLRRISGSVTRLDAPRGSLKAWLRALRVHQYAKNTLIFLPIITSHNLHAGAIIPALLAFIAFSLAASAIYLINDMIDIADDRGHPSKKLRPLACGLISIPQAMVAVPVLLVAAALVTLLLPPLFALVLAGYVTLTTAYSITLKRKMLIDVVTLAMLYVTRVLAGSAAAQIELSNWLIALCLFAFTSLALMKRYTELLLRIDRKLPDPSNRNYRKEDLPVISALAAATAMNAVTVLAFYVQSPNVMRLYSQPELLWLLCPLVLFLLSRALLMSHRRMMHDDPVIWAIKDRISRIGIVCVGAIVLLAATL